MMNQQHPYSQQQQRVGGAGVGGVGSGAGITQYQPLRPQQPPTKQFQLAIRLTANMNDINMKALAMSAPMESETQYVVVDTTAAKVPDWVAAGGGITPALLHVSGKNIRGIEVINYLQQVNQVAQSKSGGGSSLLSPPTLPGIHLQQQQHQPQYGGGGGGGPSAAGTAATGAGAGAGGAGWCSDPTLFSDPSVEPIRGGGGRGASSRDTKLKDSDFQQFMAQRDKQQQGGMVGGAGAGGLGFNMPSPGGM